jgi:RNA polymerase sigma-70 factor (ECF subfamily)
MEDVTAQERVARAAMIDHAVAGDETAFARLVTEHHTTMARVAFVICGDPELTKDILQTSWSIAWRQLHRLRDPDRIRSWLVAIAANEARRAGRRGRKRPVTDLSRFLDQHVGDDPADAISSIDLQRALAKLPLDDRRLLSLRYVAGLDSTEIARQLGLSASGVRSRLSRAIARLRMDLEHA